MTREAAVLLSEALQLPVEQRRELVRELAASLDDDPDVLASWLEVAEARAAAIDRGEAHTVPWSEAQHRIFGRG